MSLIVTKLASLQKVFNKRPVIDYTETFSRVIKPTTIYTLLSLFITQNWHLHLLDINNLFLHGTFHEEVYMAQAPGFIDSKFPSHLCIILKRYLFMVLSRMRVSGILQSPTILLDKVSNNMYRIHLYLSITMLLIPFILLCMRVM